jgi:hypothetical protein
MNAPDKECASHMVMLLRVDVFSKTVLQKIKGRGGGGRGWKKLLISEVYLKIKNVIGVLYKYDHFVLPLIRF